MSDPIVETIRRTAAEMLRDGKVGRVLGWEADPITGAPIPCAISDPEQTGRLTFNALCSQNPARYLPHPATDATLVVAKACDTRAIAVKLQERDLSREQVVVLAVGCPGAVDARRIDEKLGGTLWRKVEDVSTNGTSVTVRTDIGAAVFSIPADLLPRCVACPTPEPVIADERVGEFPSEPPKRPDPLAERVRAVETMPVAERRAYFEDAFARCIRCYACRQVCPVCNCERCIADETRPQWMARSTTGRENELYVLTRAMHLAGRCTLCGACDQVCPADLPLAALNAKLALEVRAMFGHTAGMDPAGQPPMSHYRPEDPELPGHGGEAR